MKQYREKISDRQKNDFARIYVAYKLLETKTSDLSELESYLSKGEIIGLTNKIKDLSKKVLGKRKRHNNLKDILYTIGVLPRI